MALRRHTHAWGRGTPAGHFVATKKANVSHETFALPFQVITQQKLVACNLFPPLSGGGGLGWGWQIKNCRVLYDSPKPYFNLHATDTT
ncbi:hypothetical protein [Alysiella filiformis]|uniref:hypothetical protein n=1 Tax=Alysiella filiformis TaxID=194196 RepID=UPI0015F60340|nr:hypothetical protein [Alysiella filiformis]QMT31755.1 hypothetical protein H3L97_02380 [Alysiella filiformis]UBQ55233.1 hypothetical protein JF568_06300 [Alysiella filiformis DSM 16848]